MTFTAIDIHTHIVPFDFPAYAGKHGGKRWPQMAEAHDCHHRNVMIDGRNFRTVTDECWDVEQRIAAMAQHGVQRQVLSPMPELFSYWLPDEDALALICHVNDTIGAMVARHPDRFVGLGGLPLQNPDLAARELERLMQDGRFRGAEIGRTWELGPDQTRVGKGPDNDVVIMDATVSRYHFTLMHTPKGYLVRDVGSTNGTFVEGARVVEAYVQPGMEIKAGEVSVRLTPVNEGVAIQPSGSSAFALSHCCSKTRYCASSSGKRATVCRERANSLVSSP